MTLTVYQQFIICPAIRCGTWDELRFEMTVCNIVSLSLLQPFSALTLLVGGQEGHPACKKTEHWGAGMVICLK